MKNILSAKQERFVQNLFTGMTQREAWIQAGYSSNYSMAFLDSNACKLANKTKIKARFAELNQKTVDETVAAPFERKQILTEIARGNLLDYQEVGADGGYLSIGKDSPHTKAISEITSRTEYNKDGAGAALVTKVKLHSPTSAIDLLNKMDKLYSDIPASYQDNRVINVIVSSEEGKRLTEGIKDFKIFNRGNDATKQEEDEGTQETG